MSPERLLKLLPAFEAGLTGVRDSFSSCQSSAIFSFPGVELAQLSWVLYPLESATYYVVQQQFGGPTAEHISGILTDEYSDDLSVALGSQEGLSVEESKGMRTDILSELGNVVANRFLTEWTRQSGFTLETQTPTCHNIGIESLGTLLGEGPFLSSIAAYRIDRTRIWPMALCCQRLP